MRIGGNGLVRHVNWDMSVVYSSTGVIPVVFLRLLYLRRLLRVMLRMGIWLLVLLLPLINCKREVLLFSSTAHTSRPIILTHGSDTSVYGQRRLRSG